MAIQAAARIIWGGKVSKRNGTILSDSQAAIKALNSNVMNSKAVYGCRRFLNKTAEYPYRIHIVWVPGHSGIPGNCRADELARRGTTIELSHEFSNLGIPMRTYRLIIDNAIVDSVNDR